jgi:hypothetical protein
VLPHAPHLWIRRAIQKSAHSAGGRPTPLPASGLALREAKHQWTIQATWSLLRLESSTLSKPSRADNQ